MTKFTEEELSSFDENETFNPSEELPKLNETYDNFIVVDNLPVVSGNKIEKLEKILIKLFSLKKKDIIKKFHLPIAQGSNLGHCFIEYHNKENAKEAIEKLENYPFDKKKGLFLRINILSDFKKYKDLKDSDYIVPEEPVVEKQFLDKWAYDENTREQYVIKYYDTVEVLWNDRVSKSVSIAKQKNWTKEFVVWSKSGTYLVTFSDEAIKLWGSDHFQLIGEFKHNDVKYIDFSPNDEFLVTGNNDSEDNVIFWNINSGKKKKSFTVPVPKDGLTNVWPVFKWSSDEKFVARLSIDSIVLFETQEFREKKIPISGVEDFAWSPVENNIAYWIVEKDNKPGSIGIMSLPSKKLIRSKNFYGLKTVQIHWNPSGKLLLFKTHLLRKSKETMQLEIFCLTDKNVPNSTLNFNESIRSYQWEPHGNKFAIISGDVKPNVYFYQVTATYDTKLLKVLENKTLDNIYWSPKGRYIVFASQKHSQGTLEFWDTEPLELIGEGEHFMVTDIEWDYSGRFLTTSVSGFRRQSENGFIIWSFSGKEIHRMKIEKFWQFLWRPRPKSLLSDTEYLKIKEDTMKKKKQILKERRNKKEQEKKKILSKRSELLKAFMEVSNRLDKEYASEKEERKALRGVDSDDDNDFELVDYVIGQEVLEEKEDLVS